MNHRSAVMILAGVVAFASYAVAGDSNMTATHMTMMQKRHMMSHCMEHQKAKNGRESMSHMRMECKREMKMRQRQVQMAHQGESRDGQSSNPPN
ncbi:MAG TPA: hypothetical protein VND80_06510 [Steroidobacteraceae bacterium]|nr:hypothetical protein [Steroidobacteraceae bacterium]